jgi:hypothetical protein
MSDLLVMAIVAIVAAILFSIAGVLSGREAERKSWCNKHETRTAYDHCMEHGADAKWGGDGK